MPSAAVNADASGSMVGEADVRLASTDRLAIPLVAAVASMPVETPIAARASEVAAQAPWVPRPSEACHQALELYRRLPGSLHFTSLSGTVSGGAGGEYTLEGLSEPEEVATLFSFLDTLKSLPSKVNLSYWREGGSAAGSYRFTFHGILEQPASAAGSHQAASAQGGLALLTEATAMATRAGLDSLMTRGPINTPFGHGLERLRQKYWAVGSYAQLQAFAGELAQMRDRQPQLAELVVMPAPASDSGGQRLQVYAALYVVVESAVR